MQIQFETKIKGGLPVIAVCKTYPAEPDVGVFSRQIELVELLWLSGKPLPASIENNISASDLEQIMEDAMDHLED